MNTFSVELPDEQAQLLHDLARNTGMSPEELLRALVEEWLACPGQDFAEAASYVVRKNRELYRRLA